MDSKYGYFTDLSPVVCLVLQVLLGCAEEHRWVKGAVQVHVQLHLHVLGYANNA